jgi:Rieske Fe-S protein
VTAPSGCPTRRRFLVLMAASVAAGCDAVPVEADDDIDDDDTVDDDPSTSGPIDVGAVAEIPMDSLRPVERQRLAVGRDRGGIWALSLTCRHLGCPINDPDEPGIIGFAGLMCPCHGSRYDRDGLVLTGPSEQDLHNYAVSVEDGRVLVDVTELVALGTRARP